MRGLPTHCPAGCTPRYGFDDSLKIMANALISSANWFQLSPVGGTKRVLLKAPRARRRAQIGVVQQAQKSQPIDSTR
jgi:hypothetical protein